jgi:toxin CptA
MSSSRFATPLTLKPKPSRILLGMLLLMHGGALLLLFPLALPVLAKSALATVLGLSLWHNWRQQLGRGRADRIHRVVWKGDGDWLLITAAGEELAVDLHPSTYVHPWLVVLNFRLADRRRLRSLVLLPDTLDADSFRHLRLRLGLIGDPAADDPS